METIIELNKQVHEMIKRDRNYALETLDSLKYRERRARAFIKHIITVIPKKLLSRSNVNILFNDSFTEVTFRPKYGETFSFHDTTLMTKAANNMGDRWSVDRGAESAKNLCYTFDRKRINFGHWYTIKFLNAADVDGCRIIPYKEEVTKYKVECI